MKMTVKNLVKTLSAFALGFALVSCNTSDPETVVLPSDWSEGVMSTPVYLMAGCGTSGSVSSDSLHLGYSENGLVWTALNSNNGVFTPTLGSRHIRDPYIFRMNDGSFVLLAADFTDDGSYKDTGAGVDLDYGNNPSKKIYVAFSDDLINWKYEHFLTVANSSGKYGVRYPRAMYNKVARCYDIYFTLDKGDGVQNTYFVQTTDFLTVKSSGLHKIFDAGHSTNASYVVKAEDAYYLFCRDNRADVLETKLGGDIQCAKLSTIWGNGQFALIGDAEASLSKDADDYYVNRGTKQSTVKWESEPCVYQLSSGKWIMLTNQVNSTGSYSAYETDTIEDPASWTETTSITKYTGTQMIIGTSVIAITAGELDALRAAF